MDPNATLSVIRGLVRGINNNPEEQSDEALTLAGHIEGLDEWLSKGGFLPDAWSPRSQLPPEGLPERVAEALYDQFEGAEYHDWPDATSGDRAFCRTLANAAIAVMRGE